MPGVPHGHRVSADQPEVRAHLAGAASSLMLAVCRDVATHAPTARRLVERIDLDDDAETWPEDES